MLPPNATILLVAPNASEQMGGEAIKALRCFQELRKRHPNTFLITHERNERELISGLKLTNVLIVRDDAIAVALWKSIVLRAFVDVWFSWKAVAFAEKFLGGMAADERTAVIHQVEPNSPVVPRSLAKRVANALGPINGNIYYPPLFR
jgi:hypothetical protein